MPAAMATSPAGMPLGYLHAAEPAHHDDGEADDADHRRHVHFQRRPHRDEGDGDAGERAEQGRARRDLADIGRDEAADHQDEALEEHPDETGRPALERVAGLQRDRQHDHEGDDEHVRHADARRQRADVVAASFQSPNGMQATRNKRWTGTSSCQAPAGCGRTPVSRASSARTATGRSAPAC